MGFCSAQINLKEEILNSLRYAKIISVATIKIQATHKPKHFAFEGVFNTISHLPTIKKTHTEHRYFYQQCTLFSKRNFFSNEKKTNERKKKERIVRATYSQLYIAHSYVNMPLHIVQFVINIGGWRRWHRLGTAIRRDTHYKWNLNCSEFATST